MIITNILFKTHNCRKIRWHTKVWGRVPAHVNKSFFFDGHFLTFSTVQVPKQLLCPLSRLNSFFFSLSLSLSRRNSLSSPLSLSLSFRSFRWVSAASPSRVPLAVHFFFLHFLLYLILFKKKLPPVLQPLLVFIVLVASVLPAFAAAKTVLLLCLLISRR